MNCPPNMCKCEGFDFSRHADERQLRQWWPAEHPLQWQQPQQPAPAAQSAPALPTQRWRAEAPVHWQYPPQPVDDVLPLTPLQPLEPLQEPLRRDPLPNAPWHPELSVQRQVPSLFPVGDCECSWTARYGACDNDDKSPCWSACCTGRAPPQASKGRTAAANEAEAARTGAVAAGVTAPFAVPAVATAAAAVAGAAAAVTATKAKATPAIDTTAGAIETRATAEESTDDRWPGTNVRRQGPRARPR